MERKRTNRPMLAIFTTITLVAWVFFEAYEAFKSDVKIEIPQTIIAPINPSLSTSAFDNMENRRFFTIDEISLFQPASINIETDVPRIASPSAEVDQTTQ